MGKERESRGYEDIDRGETRPLSFSAAFLKFRRGYYQEIDVEEWFSSIVEPSTELDKNLSYRLAVPASEIIYRFVGEGEKKKAFIKSPFFPSQKESQYFVVESLFFIGFEIGSQKFKKLPCEESFQRTFEILKKTRFLEDQSKDFSLKVFNEGVFLGKLLKGGATRFLKTYPFCLN